jgi:hypothetical protein
LHSVIHSHFSPLSIRTYVLEKASYKPRIDNKWTVTDVTNFPGAVGLFTSRHTEQTTGQVTGVSALTRISKMSVTFRLDLRWPLSAAEAKEFRNVSTVTYSTDDHSDMPTASFRTTKSKQGNPILFFFYFDLNGHNSARQGRYRLASHVASLCNRAPSNDETKNPSEAQSSSKECLNNIINNG